MRRDSLTTTTPARRRAATHAPYVGCDQLGVCVNDAWIAACCIVAELPLATLNVKDFEDFAARGGPRVIGPDGR